MGLVGGCLVGMAVKGGSGVTRLHAAPAHILRQIINQDKSALTPRRERERERKARPNVILASPSSTVRNDFLPTSVSFSRGGGHTRACCVIRQLFSFTNFKRIATAREVK